MGRKEKNGAKEKRNQRPEAMKNKPISTVTVTEKPFKNSVCSNARSYYNPWENEKGIPKGEQGTKTLFFSFQKPPNLMLPRNNLFHVEQNEGESNSGSQERGECEVIDGLSQLCFSVWTADTKALCPWEEGGFFSLQG